jgi:hypothetical protein
MNSNLPINLILVLPMLGWQPCVAVRVYPEACDSKKDLCFFCHCIDTIRLFGRVLPPRDKYGVDKYMVQTVDNAVTASLYDLPRGKSLKLPANLHLTTAMQKYTLTKSSYAQVRSSP